MTILTVQDKNVPTHTKWSAMSKQVIKRRKWVLLMCQSISGYAENRNRAHVNTCATTCKPRSRSVTLVRTVMRCDARLCPSSADRDLDGTFLPCLKLWRQFVCWRNVVINRMHGVSTKSLCRSWDYKSSKWRQIESHLSEKVVCVLH